ncbi:MAG: hypothetical protein GQ559_03160 [Desulfobulbaceae bacterium]|nr:hypothetical protein [Desulfobulbaceae bacterium]
MQGEKRVLPKEVKARLEMPLTLNKCGRVSLKGGVANLKQETLWVRLAGKREPVNAILIFAGKKRCFKAGELVRVHLVGQVS